MNKLNICDENELHFLPNRLNAYYAYVPITIIFIINSYH